MTNGVRVTLIATIIIPLALLPCSSPFAPWQVYAFRDGVFLLADRPASQPANQLTNQLANQQPPVPPTWHITAAALADVTHDGVAEWALLVWRPWRDWPIQRWSSVPSPIADFHDAAGQSCHLILLDPQSGREMWAGSALPAPLLALAVGDVDGDGRNEVVTLEGTFTARRDGLASHINVWRWNGFGFALEWRSPPGVFHQLRLTDVGNDGILDIVVR
jgi:hypothetical protein